MQIDCEKLAKSIQIISDELRNHNEECDTISIHYDEVCNLIIIKVYCYNNIYTISFSADIDVFGIQINTEYAIRKLIKYLERIKEE